VLILLCPFCGCCRVLCVSGGVYVFLSGFLGMFCFGCGKTFSVKV
jgi:hypothetical protein